jgi:hypothetical protein
MKARLKSIFLSASFAQVGAQGGQEEIILSLNRAGDKQGLMDS